MELRSTTRIPFPRRVVFAVYRDEMLKLVPYLPNIRRLEVRSREDAGTVVRIHNVWHGGGQIPAAARAFLSDDMLSWNDHAVWKQDDFACEWRITTNSLTEAILCAGEHRFFEDGNETRIELRGGLTIDAHKIKHVPRFLAGKVGRILEEFLADRIQPNFVSVADGVARYLRERP
ncbi:MAG: hypothetical protein V2A73_11775 [Pseudomonadota bacterium]